MHLPSTSIPTSHHYPLKTVFRTIPDPKFTTPQIRAFSSPRFPDSLNLGPVWVSMTPCLIENSRSFYPHMKVENCETTPGSGYLINPKRYPIPGSFQVPIPHFRIRFSGSNRSGANADRKYRFKWLFIENNGFIRDSNVQFSGLLWASFFWHLL